METINDKAAFSGKVTASVTHEIQNVLAIIKENAGLMDDILHMNRENPQNSVDRVQKCIDSIKKNIKRGVNLTSGLNWFAHTADHATSQINVYDTVKKLGFLIQRLLSQKGIDFLISDCDQSPSVTTDPLFFQKLIYLCIECLAEESGSKTVIQVGILPGSSHPAGVRFECNAQDIDSNCCIQRISLSPKWAEITEICGKLSATAEIITDPLCIFITIN